MSVSGPDRVEPAGRRAHGDAGLPETLRRWVSPVVTVVVVMTSALVCAEPLRGGKP